MTVTRRPTGPVLAIVAITIVLLAVVTSVIFLDSKGGSETPMDSPTSAERSGKGFPTASTTGVPQGTTLSDYSGPCAITNDSTVIDGSRISCDRLVIQAANVTIRRSILNRVDIDDDQASVTVEDSEINGGQYAAPAIGYYNITLRRVHVRGGTASVLCGSNCLIEDSLLHDQASPQADQHLGGYLSNGGSKVVVRRNSIQCSPPDNTTGGGCTGDAQIFGDFSPVTDYTFDGNLFRATPGAYCASFGNNPGAKFGTSSARIVVTNNIFERGSNGKCGSYGANTSFAAEAEGNLWQGNAWDDGTPMDPT